MLVNSSVAKKPHCLLIQARVPYNKSITLWKYVPELLISFSLQYTIEVRRSIKTLQGLTDFFTVQYLEETSYMYRHNR
jgi:hypothetical protein